MKKSVIELKAKTEAPRIGRKVTALQIFILQPPLPIAPPFLDVFNPAELKPTSLRGLMNTLVLCMSGSDDDQREVYLTAANELSFVPTPARRLELKRQPR